MQRIRKLPRIFLQRRNNATMASRSVDLNSTSHATRISPINQVITVPSTSTHFRQPSGAPTAATSAETAPAKNLVDHYAHYSPSPMTIKQFLEFGESVMQGKEFCERASCDFLRKELPVRLANIIKEIHLLPELLLAQPSTQIVQGWYEKSFEELVKYESADLNDHKNVRMFTKDLIKVRNRHNLVVETMAQGIVELNNSSSDSTSDTLPPPMMDSVTRTSIQYFLDRFYMMRISIRMLINQHAILFGGESPSSTGHVGTIDPECDIVSVVTDAFTSARSLCETYYERSPELQLKCVNALDKDDRLKIVYVPSHLYHISFELFKNAMRATCERGDGLTELPPVAVVIVKTAEDVSIKMSDLGGGIPQRNMPKLFEYMFSTAPKPSPQDQHAGYNVVPMAGYGYGLPLSRLYARYFHGDLQVYSVHGYGTDAVIYLKTLSESASELLPVYNKHVMKQYRAGRHNGWSSNSSKFTQLVEWG